MAPAKRTAARPHHGGLPGEVSVASPAACILHLGCNGPLALPGAGQDPWRPWSRDVFDDPWVHLPADQYLFKAAPTSEWLVLGGTVLALLALDALVLRRWGQTFRQHLAVLGIWLLVGAGYNAYFWARWGRRSALDWCTGFLLEWMLSLDNLFVFHVLFRFYRTPQALQPRILFLGIVGAAACRLFVFSMLGALMHIIHWVRVLFGLLLIYSGLSAAAEEEVAEGEEAVSTAAAVRLLRWLLGDRLHEHYDLPNAGDGAQGDARAAGRLFLRDGKGRLCVTLSAYVLLCVEATDLVFAVDSVSAKVAQIPNQYVAYSSSVLALFGLRSAFFVVRDLVDCFELVKYGICIVLIFVGVELVVSPFVHLESSTVCVVIVSVFTTSIFASTARRLLCRGGKEGAAPASGSPESR